MRRLLIFIVLGLILPIVTRAAEEVPTEDRAEALAAIRQALAVRDLAGLKQNLALAARLKGDERFDSELIRLEELADYVARFWQAVQRGCESLENVNELEVGEERVAVVEYAAGRLVLRVKGQNRAYAQKDMPPKLALTLAQRVLKPDAPENKVFFGAMLALDSKGDRQIARQYWDEAAAAGIDVKRFLPELSIPLPPPPVEIPAMNPVLKNLLSERSWSARKRTDKGWIRQDLEGIGQQNDEGRLEIRIPAEHEGPLQVVARRQVSGDFVCRMIVSSSDKTNAVGLFAAGVEDEGFTAPLPRGTALIELSRQQGMLTCKINGTHAELTTVGKPAPRASGYVGLQLSPGSELTLMAVEFAAR